MYFIRVSLHIGARHNAEMNLYGTVYRRANRLRYNETPTEYKATDYFIRFGSEVFLLFALSFVAL